MRNSTSSKKMISGSLNMSEKISAVPEVIALADTDLFALAEDTGVGATGFESRHVTVATLVEYIENTGDFTTNTSIITLIDDSIGDVTTTDITEGNNLYFTEERIRTEVEEEVNDYTLVLADGNHKWKTITSATPADLLIPAQASVAWPANTYIELHQGGAGAITIVPDTGVTVLCNENLTLVLNGLDAVAAIKRLEANVWIAFGNLVPL
jgi:hypothetical protein